MPAREVARRESASSRRAADHASSRPSSALTRALIGRRAASRSRRSRRASDAARRLRDADRQPRGRDAARAARAARRPTSSSARTRGTRSGLLDRHGIEAQAAQLPPSTTRRARTAELLPRLAAGERIALVSDAGLPGVNDPGARLIAAALEAGVPVTVLPGRVRGRDGARRERSRGERFQFLGYLPRRSERARGALGGAGGVAASCWSRSSRRKRLAGDAPLARRRRCRTGRSPSAAKLTKRFEEVVRGTGARGRGAIRGAAEGRVDARRRGAPASLIETARRMTRSRPWSSSLRPVCHAAGRPRTSSRRLARISRNTSG